MILFSLTHSLLKIIIILGDSKWLRINMATMCENLCGWDRGDICMTFHMRAFDFLYHCKLTVPMPGYELSNKCQLYPTT
jgi:hypothetical protein